MIARRGYQMLCLIMAEHEEMAVFLGGWHAEGTSYGGDEQWPDNQHAGASLWTSIHSARWHSGNYFIVQDERANGPFDTLSLMGWEWRLSEVWLHFALKSDRICMSSPA